LVVEVDGGQHLDSAGDSVRDLFLTAKDFRVLRFWNDQVLKETDLVLQVILDALPALSADPSPTVVGEGNSQ
jgi:very-short-patch-repair endonuclease